LTAWAAHQFALDRMPGKGLQTDRIMLEDYEARTGKTAIELDGPHFPSGLEYVWGWFCELDRARSGTGFGANPVSWQEIDAWARTRRLTLSTFEVECLTGLDQVRLEELAKKNG